MAITLDDIKRAAQEHLYAGITAEDLAAYGANIGLSPEEIAYALGQTKTLPTKMSDLEKVKANDEYITSIAKQLGDKSVSAGEQLALSNESVLDLAERALERQNVDKISDANLAAYGSKLGINQDLIDYLLGTEMNLDTSGKYDIAGNVKKAVDTERAIQKSLGGAEKAKDLTPADYLAAALKYAPPTGSSTVTGGKGNDTIKESGYLEGATGYDFAGENTGLRDPYVPFVGQMLGRVSALMAARNAPGFKPMEFGVNYGQDTAKELTDLQKERESRMSGDKAFKPYAYSFVPKPAKSGGVMSLVEGYDAGGNVSSGSNTGMQGSEVIPSAFDKPDAFTPTQFSSTYTTPTNTYTGPGAGGITTGTFDPNAITQFTNSFTTAVTDPQVREAKRQAELAKLSQAAKFTQAGAFGGSGRILAENEIGRNLATQIGDIYGKGQKEAFDAALRAFEAEQGRKLTADIETEKARQEAGRQGLTGAETAARYGLDASKMTEQSKQFGATYGLQTAQSEAQYQQLARDLQQRAEEAAARGDQFEASLALQQLQEANRAAESARGFEYQQQRDMYLDPFREAGYMSQILGGLPISAAATGVSPNMEAIAAMLGLGTVLKPSDRRLKTDIQTIGVLSDGLKVYSYRYKSGGPMQIGVMADEVAILRPQAYIKGGAGDGFDAVDYAKL